MGRPVVAVVGSGMLAAGDPRRQLAHDLGRALVEAGYRICCGGLGGVMEAVARGAREAPAHQPGDVIGLLPGTDPAAANPWIDVAVPTGLGHLRNSLVVRADAVVAVGGGAGTLSEIALAWVFDRPVIAFRTDGWSGELADRRLDARTRFADRADDRVYGIDRPEEAITLLRRLVPIPVSRR